MGPAGELAENQGEDHHKRHEAQHHQRQCVIDQQHGSEYADDHHGIFGQGDQNVGEHKGDGVGVVGDAGHQFTHRHTVQLLVAETFNVGEQIQANLRQNFLSRLLQDHGLEIGADQRHDQNAGVRRHQGKQLGQSEIVTLDQSG